MNRGEIWSINLDPNVGAEINKIRPAIIVNDDAVGTLPLRVIVPITNWNERYLNSPWMVRIAPDSDNRLTKTSAADAFQVRSLSTTRFKQKIGFLPVVKMQEISKALALVLDCHF